MNIDFKIAVFDLDNTLWNGEELYSETIDILEYLKNKNVFLYIASYHQDALSVCRNLNILKYFDGILYGTEQTKLEMINIIKANHVNDETEIVFFDDNMTNIRLVRDNSKVHCIYVGRCGLSSYHLIYLKEIEAKQDSS